MVLYQTNYAKIYKLSLLKFLYELLKTSCPIEKYLIKIYNSLFIYLYQQYHRILHKPIRFQIKEEWKTLILPL